MAGVDFLFSGGDESVDQIVGLHTEAFAARDFYIRTGFVFFGKLVAQFGGAARSERDHLIGKMRVVVSLLVVAESAQGFDDRVLCLGLASINDVVNFRYI